MAQTLVLLTASADETRAVGEAVATVLQPGDVVALSGDLGSGKTVFVQGAARALGVDEPVVSPTFTLVREYAGRLPVTHLDVFRLERIQEVLDLGFEEMLDAGGVVFIEWGDAIETMLPASYLLVALTTTEQDLARRAMFLRGVGPAWESRWDGLTAVTAAWAAE